DGESLLQVSADVAANLILEDVRLGTIELASLSFLYFHYVRVDLGISLELFCKASSLEERSLRRYQQYAVKRLTDVLASEEWDVRKQQNKRRLYTELPYATASPLPGRQTLIADIKAQIEEGNQHILLTGAPGIGITHLISGLLQEYIDQMQLDRLVWINEPQ